MRVPWGLFWLSNADEILTKVSFSIFTILYLFYFERGADLGRSRLFDYSSGLFEGRSFVRFLRFVKYSLLQYPKNPKIGPNWGALSYFLTSIVSVEQYHVKI